MKEMWDKLKIEFIFDVMFIHKENDNDDKDKDNNINVNIRKYN